MAEANFKSLQILHESLLQKQQKVSEENQQAFTKDVREYIEQAKRGGSNISSTRERDQVRANLRYWANYIYSIDKTFPDIELAPSAIESKPFSATIIGILITLALLIALLAWAGTFLFRGGSVAPAGTQTSLSTPTLPTEETQTSEPIQATEPPTSVFVGSNVVMTSPENGENVLPKIIFEGTYTILKSENTETTIHVLMIRSDRLYPIKDFFPIPPDAAAGDWDIPATLYLKPEELQKAETLVVVPAACLDNSCRDKLANAIETGIAIDDLPSPFSFTLYRDSSRVVYRNAYDAITGIRLVYSFFDENSFDLYISNPDESDSRRIKFTPEYSEIFPNLSPDGTKIVYVKLFREPTTNTRNYAIAIMDSNGENDHEITAWSRNVLEYPQWSSDANFISYAMGEQRGSSNVSDWNIHIYELETQTDKTIFKDAGRYRHRYHTWMPDTNEIIFDARPQESGTVGFDIVSMDSLEKTSHFFDSPDDEDTPDDERILWDDIQPNIKPFENGYLLTYTTVDPDKNLNVFAVVLDSDQQILYGPRRLTYRRAGEIVDGIKIGGADFPISDPHSNLIYYSRHGNIYRVEFMIKEGKLEPIVGPKGDSDGEHYGDLVIETVRETEEILGFDIGNMEAFFPIQ